MATADVTMLGGKPALLLDGSKPGDKVLLVAWLPEGSQGTVEYERLWADGYEGDAVRIGKTVIPLEIVYAGPARTVSGTADDLHSDEEDLGWQR
jgi:hypothetical protein